jgi:hypothetical protein
MTASKPKRDKSPNTFAAANRCPASQAGTRVDLGASGTSGAIALIVLLK